tara:strand:- start:172 stop:573 length:402 start_codon:yes stop_codon:yes gene_type:complete
MDEEQNYDFKPINSNCSPTEQVKIVDSGTGSKNNESLDKTSNQANADAQYDSTNQVNAMYGGNIYGLKNYEINYKKKKIYLKTFNITEALFHIINNFKIKKDCLFEVNEINNKNNRSIYHFKNNKKKVINKIR